MRQLLRILVLFWLLAVIYQCSQSSYLSRSFEYDRNSFEFFNSQSSIKRRSVQETKLGPFNAILGVASSNVPAYSNGNDTYYSGENNYMYEIFMGLKWQCVEYARRWTFLRKSSVFGSVEGANDMWSQLTYVERVSDKKQFPLKRHPNGSPKPPMNETYLIYPIQKDMPFGHVAVIVEVLPKAIRIAEQNFYFNYWPKNYSREIPLVYRNDLYYINDTYSVFGWMEIDDNKQLKPLDQATIQKLKNEQARTLNSGFSHFNSYINIYFFSFLFVVSHRIFT